MMKAEGKSKKVVGDAIIKKMKPKNIIVHSITFDNGTEFSDHKNMSKKLVLSQIFLKLSQSLEVRDT